jgi:hypothetical protein
MKTILRFVGVVFWVVSGMNPLLAQWVQTSGPYGGVVLSFAVSGNNLFAGTGSLLCRNKETTSSAINERRISQSCVIIVFLCS